MSYKELLKINIEGKNNYLLYHNLIKHKTRILSKKDYDKLFFTIHFIYKNVDTLTEEELNNIFSEGTFGEWLRIIPNYQKYVNSFDIVFDQFYLHDFDSTYNYKYTYWRHCINILECFYTLSLLNESTFNLLNEKGFISIKDFNINKLKENLSESKHLDFFISIIKRLFPNVVNIIIDYDPRVKKISYSKQMRTIFNLVDTCFGVRVKNVINKLLGVYQSNSIEIHLLKNNKNLFDSIQKLALMMKKEYNLDVYIFEVLYEIIIKCVFQSTNSWLSETEVYISLNYMMNIYYRKIIEFNNRFKLNKKEIKFLMKLIIEFLIEEGYAVKRKEESKYSQWIVTIDSDTWSYLIPSLMRKNIYSNLNVNKIVSDWYYSDEKIVYNNSNNKGLFNNTTFYINNHTDKLINKDNLEKINKIQKIPYNINFNLLEVFIDNKINIESYILQQSPTIILPYRKDFRYFQKWIRLVRKESWYCSMIEVIKKERKSNKFIVRYEEVINKYINSSEKVDVPEEVLNYALNLKKWRNLMSKNKKLVREMYMSIGWIPESNAYKSSKKSLHINDMLCLFILFFINKDDDIYNYIMIDKRGRIYIRGLFSYISIKFIRMLVKLKVDHSEKEKIMKKMIEIIKFYGEIDYKSYYICRQLGINENIFYSEKLIKEYVEIHNKKIKRKRKEKEKVFTLKELFMKDDNINISNKMNLLKIDLDDDLSTVSIDASSSLLQILSLLLKDYNLMYYTNVIKTSKPLDVYNFLIEKIKVIYKDHTFYNFYVNRKIVKYVCMTYLYGSTAKYISKDMLEKFSMNILLEDMISIAANIISIFNKYFPSVKLIKKTINFYTSVLPTKRSFKYDIFGKKVSYTECSMQELRISDKKKLHFDISINVQSLKVDVGKRRRSSLVNIVHSLDSYLCLNTRHDLLTKYNINCLSVHDCFIIPLKYSPICISTYNKYLSNIYNTSIKDILYDFKNIDDVVKDYDYKEEIDLANLKMFYRYLIKDLNQVLKSKNKDFDINSKINKKAFQKIFEIKKNISTEYVKSQYLKENEYINLNTLTKLIIEKDMLLNSLNEENIKTILSVTNYIDDDVSNFYEKLQKDLNSNINSEFNKSDYKEYKLNKIAIYEDLFLNKILNNNEYESIFIKYVSLSIKINYEKLLLELEANFEVSEEMKNNICKSIYSLQPE